VARTIYAEGHIEWHEGEIKTLLVGPGGETSADIQRRARAVQRRAQYRAPFRTGLLRHSISVNTRNPPDGAVASITSKAPYSMMVEFGRRRVTPSGKFLVWENNGVPVFAKAAAAVSETPFMRDALDAAAD
jgi:hypothetical protein